MCVCEIDGKVFVRGLDARLKFISLKQGSSVNTKDKLKGRLKDNWPDYPCQTK